MFGPSNIKSRIREIQSCHAIPDARGTGARKYSVGYTTDDCGSNTDKVMFDGLDGEPLFTEGGAGEGLGSLSLDEVGPNVRRERPCYLFARKFGADTADKILGASARIVGI